MSELKNKLDMAFKMISSMTVSGDNQDKAVLAKENLRAAYKLLSEIEKEQEKEQKEDG